MDFLDLVKIGSKVNINVNLSKDRLNTKTLNALNDSSICLVKDFKLTDGKGVGVVVELSSGDNEWFFENEIEILDDQGKIVKRDEKIENNLIKEFLENMEYSPRNKPKDLINPLNFFSWFIYSIKDVF